MSDGEWVDNVDYYQDIQSKIPGVQFSSGFRTPEYQADMAKRGYHPAQNSGHLDGSKMDILPPKGKSMSWLKQQIQMHYPEATINPNEGDHADVRFPGWHGAPALGGAAKAGLVNPDRPADGEWIDDVAPPEQAASVNTDPLVNTNNPQAQAPHDPLFDKLTAEQNAPGHILGGDSKQVAGADLGEAPEGNWGERVWNALQTDTLPDSMKNMPFASTIDAVGKVMAAGTEAIRGTPLEGAMLASPLGGAEIGGMSALGRIPKLAAADAATVQSLVKSGKSLDEINAYLKTKGLDHMDEASYAVNQKYFQDNPDAAPGAVVEKTLADQNPTIGESGYTSKSRDDVQAATRFSNDEVEKMLRPTPEQANHTAVQDAVTATTKDWKNSPNVKVVDSSELPADMQADLPDDAMGVYGKDGTVHILSDRVTPEETPSVVFHEALGHAGLNNLFKTDMDDALLRLYKGNKALKDEVDARTSGWDDDLHRSIEEVLAERSEAGQVGLTGMDRLRQTVKNYARKVGIKLDVTDREVSRILGMAHNTVTDGEGTASGSGLRFMRRIRKNPIPRAANDTGLEEYMSQPSEAKMLHGEPDDWVLNEETGWFENAKPKLVPNDKYMRRDKPGYTHDDLAWEAEMAKLSQDADRRKLVEQKLRDQKKARAEEDRYMRRRKDGGLYTADVAKAEKNAKENPQREGKVEGFNLDRTQGPLDTKPLQAEIARSFPKETISHAETRAKAATSRITPEEVKSVRESLEGVESKVLQARQEAQRASNRRARLAKRIEVQKERGNVDPNLLNEYSKALVHENALIEDTKSIGSSAGRLLNQYNIIAKGDDIPEHMRFMTKQKDFFDHVDKSPLSDAEKVDAKTAFVKLIEGNKLNKDDMATLKKILPTKEIKHLQDPRTFRSKVNDSASNLLNMPRSLMSSMDLSAPLRQGLFLINRKEFWNSFAKMFQYLGSEKAYNALRADIQSRPNFPLMEKAGIDFTDMGTKLTKREEAFMSNWAEKIPVVGQGVKMSERAFVGFLNKLRADTFDSLVNASKKAGVDFTDDPKALLDIGNFVNTATGRGELGALKNAGPLLNSVLFSPRLLMSRLSLLNPNYYVQLSPVVRREALKSLLALGGIALTVTSLAKMAGLSVEADPRSSDFAKIRTGNTRYDILGGFGQYITLGARLATNEKKTAKGGIQELGAKFGSDTRLDVGEKFFENKLAPIASFVADYLRGKDPVGNKFEPTTEIASRFTPLIMQDMADLYKDGGIESIWKAAPSVFGVGTTTYDENKKPNSPTKKAEPKQEVAKGTWE